MVKLVQIPLSQKIVDRRIDNEAISKDKRHKRNACYFDDLDGK